MLKPGPEHHGVLRWSVESLPAIRQLNQGTFFSFTELTDQFETPSAVHLIYGDSKIMYFTNNI